VPTSKTAAAAAAQFLVLRDNLDALMGGRAPDEAKYDGYSSCPLVTKKGAVMMMEVGDLVFGWVGGVGWGLGSALGPTQPGCLCSAARLTTPAAPPAPPPPCPQFGYGGKILETFTPLGVVDQSKEEWLMWLVRRCPWGRIGRHPSCA
jgi:hypothetical protein